MQITWNEIYERIHAIKLSTESVEFTSDFVSFITNAIESVEQLLLSNFDEIIPDVGGEFNPILHEQIGYVQNGRISKVFSYGKIKDGIVIFKAKVKR